MSKLIPLGLVKICLLVLLLSGVLPASDKKPPTAASWSFETQGIPRSAQMNINNVQMWASDNGMLERRLEDLRAGVRFPRGTSTVVFAGGLIWAGRVQDDRSPILRIGGQTYNIGTVPGRIISPGVTENPNNADVRIYRIRRDWATADLTQEAVDIYGITIFDVTQTHIDAIREQYKRDWIGWPWQKGAPYYEKNGVNGYQPDPNGSTDSSFDEPGLGDADQVIWFVANDLDPNATTRLYSSPPIGLEMQVTCWAYKRGDELDNAIYQRYRLIYKGLATTPATAEIRQMRLAKWVDADVGNAADDFAGCDIGRNLGFVYNANPVDEEFDKFNATPPVVGYDLLQGPRVPQAGATAHWNMQTIEGYENLPMTTFTYFSDTRLTDFNLYTFQIGYTGLDEWWNVLRGFNARPLSPPQCFIDPTTDQCTNYELWGDPQTFRGWVDGRIESAGDRRIVLASGPFRMAVGDTQEVVVALLAAQGKDHRDGVGLLKNIDDAAQDAFEFNFELPSPIPVPSLRIVELDKKLILDWETDTAQIRKIELYNSKGYRFETYTIYQFPYAHSTIDQATVFPPFDITLPRYLDVSLDRIRNRPLVNGQQYHYAVTASVYNPHPAIAKYRLESPVVVKTATPHSPNPGIIYPYQLNEEITDVKNVVGDNDAIVKVSYFDPTKPDGHAYKIRFHRSSIQLQDIVEKPTWDFMDLSSFKTGVAVGGSRANGSGSILLRSSNGEFDWTEQATGEDRALNAVSFADVHTGTAVGAGGLILRTIDGGKTWKSQTSGLPVSLFGVSMIDDKTATAVGELGTILRTNDGGETWSNQTSPATDTLHAVSFIDFHNGLAVGPPEVIYHTTNAGSTWRSESTHVPENLYGVSFNYVNLATAVGRNGTILHATDGGYRWTSQNSGTLSKLRSVFFSSANAGTIVGDGGIILRTTDRGATWYPQSSGQSALLSNVSFMDDLIGAAVGSNGTLLTTSNGGEVWQPQESGTTTDLYGVSLSREEMFLRKIRIDTVSRRVVTRGLTVQAISPLFGMKGVYQVLYNNQPTRVPVFNVPNPEGNYMVVGAGTSQLDTIAGGSANDATVELRFTGDSSWALFIRGNVPESPWVRVPYTAWQVGRVGVDSVNRQLYTVITLQGADSVWRPSVLLDREYNGKTLSVFYPVTIFADSFKLGFQYYVGTYYEDIPWRSDGFITKGFLWNNSTYRAASRSNVWRAYIADLDGDGIAAPSGTTIRFERFKVVRNRDEKVYQSPVIITDNVDAARKEVERVNVFPNPYYGFNRAETDRFNRFVTFNHLSYKATIRVFNLSGVLVKTVRKEDDTQFVRWDLTNENGLPVAGGIYLAQVELHDRFGNDLGAKNLKLMIVREQQFLGGN
ncbi:MAG: hypothetical protein HY707_03795 [Ignavibacteriae bacterium]|nr:hypothetical protein [Ignavibacteriota bacterium]